MTFTKRAEEFEQNPAPVDYCTVSYRCALRGVALSQVNLVKAGRRAAQHHRAEKGGSPRRAPELILIKDAPGYVLLANTYVYAYGPEDLHFLDEAIDHVLLGKGRHE